eukprot:scaffold17819_cov120-Isochrysis_galbana.AAC.2
MPAVRPDERAAEDPGAPRPDGLHRLMRNRLEIAGQVVWQVDEEWVDVARAAQCASIRRGGAQVKAHAPRVPALPAALARDQRPPLRASTPTEARRPVCNRSRLVRSAADEAAPKAQLAR